jgi:tetratricopeptide (TPR) repeat protein
MRGFPPAKGPDLSEAASIAAVEERNRCVEVEFLEGVRTRLPTHPAVVESLGCLYTEMGKYTEGLQADREMVDLEPQSHNAWYNLACSLSLTEQTDAAFDALEKAIALGYNDAEWMQEDEDFFPIRTDPRFVRLLAQMLSRKA